MKKRKNIAADHQDLENKGKKAKLEINELSPIQQLPDEIMFEILGYLELDSFKEIPLVCKKWLVFFKPELYLFQFLKNEIFTFFYYNSLLERNFFAKADVEMIKSYLDHIPQPCCKRLLLQISKHPSRQIVLNYLYELGISKGIESRRLLSVENEKLFLWAVICNQIEVIRKLLKGIDLEDFAYTCLGHPLILAATYGYVEMIHLLLAEGKINVNLDAKSTVTIGYYPLQFIACYGPKTFETFDCITSWWMPLQFVANYMPRILEPFRWDSGTYTPLYYASLNGHLETIRVLLKYNASLKEGKSPLFAAALGGHLDVFQELSPLADPDDLVTSKKFLLVSLATKGREADLDDVLNKFKIDINIRDRYSSTVLHDIIEGCFIHLHGGVSRNYSHTFPAFYKMFNEQRLLNACRLLINRGADPNLAREYYGHPVFFPYQNALQIAIYQRMISTTKLLLSYPHKIDFNKYDMQFVRKNQEFKEILPTIEARYAILQTEKLLMKNFDRRSLYTHTHWHHKRWYHYLEKAKKLDPHYFDLYCLQVLKKKYPHIYSPSKLKNFKALELVRSSTNLEVQELLNRSASPRVHTRGDILSGPG